MKVKNTQEKQGHISLIGHSQVTKIVERNIWVPSLSNVKVGNLKNFMFIPQALDITICFHNTNKTFGTVIVDQVVMKKNPYIINEHVVYLNNPKYTKRNLEIEEYPSLERKI